MIMMVTQADQLPTITTGYLDHHEIIAYCWRVTHDFKEQGHHRFAPETIEFPLSKNQTKWPIELWTLKQEMETDEDHATMRESFLLVQNILSIEYTDTFPAHV